MSTRDIPPAGVRLIDTLTGRSLSAQASITCHHDPLQVEGTLHDGRSFYFRVRSGRAELSTAPAGQDPVTARGAVTVAESCAPTLGVDDPAAVAELLARMVARSSEQAPEHTERADHPLMGGDAGEADIQADLLAHQCSREPSAAAALMLVRADDTLRQVVAHVAFELDTWVQIRRTVDSGRYTDQDSRMLADAASAVMSGTHLVEKILTDRAGTVRVTIGMGVTVETGAAGEHAHDVVAAYYVAARNDDWCPGCATPLGSEGTRALSRRQPGVEICRACGVEEALEDILHRSAPARPEGTYAVTLIHPVT